MPVLDIIANGKAVVVTINRPESLNALNKQVFDELHEFFTQGFKNFPAARGVVITGSGPKAFAAGADIKEFMSYAPQEAQQLSKRGHEVFRGIELFHLPVIAAVNGFALGGGCELALSCHIRVAGTKARFGLPEVNLGLVPGYAGTQRLPQLVGRSKALEMIMTTDMVNGEEAHQIGLANHVVPEGEEVAKALEIIEKIATKGPNAIAAAILCVDSAFDAAKDGAMEEQRLFGTLFDKPESKEGIGAFMEKRAPQF